MSNESLRNMLNNIINEKQEEASLDFHSYLKTKIRETVGLNEAPKSIDQKATRKEADRIVAQIKKHFNVSVDVSIDKDGYAKITVNNGQLPDNKHSDNEAVVTAKNLGKVIDKEYYDFRNKGWIFTQPVNGEFTIGVTE